MGDPDHFRKPDLDPLRSKKVDPDLCKRKTPDPDLYERKTPGPLRREKSLELWRLTKNRGGSTGKRKQSVGQRLQEPDPDPHQRKYLDRDQDPHQRDADLQQVPQ